MDSADRDDFAALDFSAGSDAEAENEHQSDPLDFSAAEDHREDSGVGEFLDDYTHTETEPAETELDALIDDADEEADEDELAPYTFTVTNPPGLVSVSALIGGKIREVGLSPRVTGMTEDELAEEIIVLADLARKKGLAGQQTYLTDSDLVNEGMREMGLNGGEVVRDFMVNGLGMPTPEQAEAEQAEVFATRYTNDRG